MYVATIANRNSPPAILLRESYRKNGKVKTRTLANLSRWSPDKVEQLRRVLMNQPPKAKLQESFDITRSLSHGHVVAVLGTIGNLVSLLRSLRRNNRLQVFLHRSEDLVGALGPDEGLGVLVPGLGPLGNPSVEFGHTVVNAALEVLGGQG
jgi:hypothetical protein